MAKITDYEISEYLNDCNEDSDFDIDDVNVDYSSESDVEVTLDANRPRASTSQQNNATLWDEVQIGSDIVLNSIPIFTLGNKPRVKFDNLLTPTESFHKFFPESIYKHVAEQTNLYSTERCDVTTDIPKRSRLHQLKDIDENHMKAFVATQISMGLVHKPNEESYFQDGFWLTKTPGFSKIFSRDQYQLIKSFLHFNDNANQIPKGNPGYDPLFKIRPLLDIVSKTYLDNYEPGEALSIDESMIKFKGRLSFKQYLPSKPSSKWGIKVWSLCDSSNGFLLKFKVYTGKESDNKDEGLGSRVVKDLLVGFEFSNRTIYMDNFYSSVNLFNDLKLNGLGACGTVRANRKNLPIEMKTLKKKKGDPPTTWINNSKDMIACSWQDTGKVNMLSTVGDTGVKVTEVRSKTGRREVTKPNIQICYNKNMGGVDLFDKFCSTYPYGHKSMKWYQPLWHFIIEVGLVNGCIAYNMQDGVKPLTHKKFREEVIDGLLSKWEPATAVRRGRRMSNPLDNRLSGKIHFISQFDDKTHKPNCAVCSILPSSCSKKGKGTCKRKQTTYFCKTCLDQPPLCVVPCFEVYHTTKIYKKTCNC